MMKHKSKGFTLIELMSVVAIIAILALLAIPSYKDTLQRQRVEGAAEGLLAAMQNAKAEAIKSNSARRIVFMPATIDTSHSNWCYGMTQAGQATCVCWVDADATNDCATGSVVQNADYTGVKVSFNTTNSRVFNPLRGTSTNGTVIFSGGNNITLGVRSFQIGRVRMCKPTGTTIISYSDSGAC